MFSEPFLLVAFASLSIVFALVYRKQRRIISHVRGPSNPSLLLGVEYIWPHQEEVGILESKWFHTYGNIVRVPTFFGEDQLFVADPKACQYILQASQYNFPKTADAVARFKVMFGGMGMLSSTGDVHQRQRRVMLPAFTKMQLRSFLDVFQYAGENLSQHWKEALPSNGGVLNVAPWLSRTTLDVIGQSAFEYKFNSLNPEAEKGELAVALKNLFVESLLYPSKAAILLQGLLRVSPAVLRPLFGELPTRQNIRFKRFFKLAVKVVQQIINERLNAANPEGTKDKDVLSVLLRANRAEDPKKRLSDEELIAQLMTIIIAGHDTTAGSVSWTLYELSKHPKDQDRLRDEIRERRRGLAPGEELSELDYESMPVLNATIKEALRLHPVVHSMARYAKHDDVLPLSEPLMTMNGPVTEVPISKGQVVNVSVWEYNRLKSVWGEDAEEWNVERWLSEHERLKQTGVGMVSNILTFSGGLQGCIGWRFAMMEAQALVVHLVESFEYAPDPNTKNNVVHAPVGRATIPVVRGNAQGGVQVPLLVKAISR